MDFMGHQRFITLPFILILATLIAVSSAGGHRRFFDKYAVRMESTMKEPAYKDVHHDQQASVARYRVLKVNTNDYGRYDPSPSLDKPPFKLIPN